MSLLSAHLLCILLVALDYLARAWRIQLMVRGVGSRLTFAAACAVNAIGDAACALTPLRIAGEPARLGVLLKAGVPATASFVAITYEVLAAWPVIIAGAGVLFWRHAPEWWASAGPNLVSSAREAWPWVLVVTMLTLLVWLWVRRSAPAASRHLKRPVRRIRVHWRRMPWPALLLTAPLTFINLASRVAILPVLAATLPDPPPVGPMLVGSFALLYSQLILPTPSGVGAVDLGFIGGAAGNLGDSQGSLLLAWRFYTTGVGVIVGLVMGVHQFGWRPIRSWVRVNSQRVTSDK